MERPTYAPVGRGSNADATPSTAPSNRVLEAAADPAATRKNPFTLRFASPVLEAAFHAEYRRAALGNARLAAALALVLVMAFGALDWLIQTTVVEQLWIIRYGVLTPYLIALLGATYVRVLRPYLEWGLLGIVVVVGGPSAIASGRAPGIPPSAKSDSRPKRSSSCSPIS